MPAGQLYLQAIPQLLEMMNGCLFFLDHQSLIHHVSAPSSVRLTPRHWRGRLFFQAIRRFPGVNSMDIDTAKHYFDRALHYQQSIKTPKLHYVSHTGETNYFSIQFTPILHQNTELICAIIHDITDMTLMIDEFEAVSHQFDNTSQELYTVMSQLDLQLMDINRAKQQITALNNILANLQQSLSADAGFLQRVGQEVVYHLGYGEVSILEFDTESQEFSIAFANTERYKSIQTIHNKHTDYEFLRQAIEKSTVQMQQRSDGVSMSASIAVSKLLPLSVIAVPLKTESALRLLVIHIGKDYLFYDYELDIISSLGNHLNILLTQSHQLEQEKIKAITDGLTGLYNYRYFQHKLKIDYAEHTTCSVMMIDVDHFKYYNDTNGHQAGDGALKLIAHLLHEVCRPGDCAVRYGGEEFAIFLPGTAAAEAGILAEKLRNRIAQYPFNNGKAQPLGMLTASIGVAGSPTIFRDADDMVAKADAALYEAKRVRNSVRMHGQG